MANLVRWQEESEVAVWWGDTDKTHDELTEKWMRRTGALGSDYDRNTDRYIIVVDGHDIGHVQSYALRHYRNTLLRLAFRMLVVSIFLLAKPSGEIGVLELR